MNRARGRLHPSAVVLQPCLPRRGLRPGSAPGTDGPRTDCEMAAGDAVRHRPV